MRRFIFLGVMFFLGANSLPEQYPPSMKAAAHRHFEAADKLYEGHRKDVAGYLYGIAAECALKALMAANGMRPLPPEQKRDDPFYAHFATLKTLLRDAQQGRRGADIRKFVENPRFMAQWDTKMRYSDGKQIADRWIDEWRKNASDVIAEI